MTHAMRLNELDRPTDYAALGRKLTLIVGVLALLAVVVAWLVR